MCERLLLSQNCEHDEMNQRQQALNEKRECCQKGKREKFFHLVSFLYGESEMRIAIQDLGDSRREFTAAPNADNCFN